MMEDETCVVCGVKVRTRQHGIPCDSCGKWTHRTCGTGISIGVYRLAIRNKSDIPFSYVRCLEPIQNHDDSMDIEPPVDATLDDIPDRTFDLGRHDVDMVEILERSLADPAISDSIVEGPDAVTYEVVEHGTNKQRKKLISSDGYAFTVKQSTSKCTQWRCSVRSKSNWCRASINQRGNEFRPGCQEHSHPADPSIGKKVKIHKKVKSDAVAQVHTAASEIVDSALQELMEADTFSLPNRMNLCRTANRTRHELRPAEPVAFDFTIDTDFLKCDDFLIGDVRLPDARHVIFSTERQRDLLKETRRWFLDGTFNVVKEPFCQLYSIHGFIQKDGNLKQVPLVFILMTRRRTEDYIAMPTFPTPFSALEQDVTHQGLVELLNYMRHTWMESNVWPPKNWSIYRQTIRTNNDCEGWHHRLNSKAKRGNMQFYVLVPMLRQEAEICVTLQQQVAESHVVRRHTVKSRKIAASLEDLWDQYDGKTISTSAFIRRVGKLYGNIAH